MTRRTRPDPDDGWTPYPFEWRELTPGTLLGGLLMSLVLGLAIVAMSVVAVEL